MEYRWIRYECRLEVVGGCKVVDRRIDPDESARPHHQRVKVDRKDATDPCGFYELCQRYVRPVNPGVVDGRLDQSVPFAASQFCHAVRVELFRCSLVRRRKTLLDVPDETICQRDPRFGGHSCADQQGTPSICVSQRVDDSIDIAFHCGQLLVGYAKL